MTAASEPNAEIGVPALSPEALRWRCDPASLSFDSTAEVDPYTGIAGQQDAVEALRFGLEIDAPGQNIFVRGLAGTGRLTLVKNLLEEILPACPLAADRCYVHNFEQLDRPRLITLPRSQGAVLKRSMNRLIEFVRDDLGDALQSESVQNSRKTLEHMASKEIEGIGKPFDEELRQSGLALVTIMVGQVAQPAIVPLVDDQPVAPEALDELQAKGSMTAEEAKAIRDRIPPFAERLEKVGESIRAVRAGYTDKIRTLYDEEVRLLMRQATADIRHQFTDASVQRFLDAVTEDAVQRLPQEQDSVATFTRRYRVNVICGHGDDEGCPIIVENVPTMQTLAGNVDVDIGPDENPEISHMSVRSGSLLAADGGYLIMEARDVIADAGAWRTLIRTLRAGQLDIVQPEFEGPWARLTLKPEPIPIKVKVILLGDAGIYAALDDLDPDFPNLFKVLADFESVIDRDDAAVRTYAGVLSRFARDENLPPFDRTAVAELLEHGARIAAQPAKVTTRFGRLADVAREAAYLARKDVSTSVTGEHVINAVRRNKRRGDLPARRFRELIDAGTIRIATRGTAVGQVNGLAVASAGPLSYGFPARITATIGPGTAGTINIEREAALSGAIHTKGFYILGGLLRYLLRTDHPLAFSASIAFEQSYGGIDGDSASGAEMCCLLSALTDVALRQDLAMTGAIDQVGNILPIGAVNEKIEGYFDACLGGGLSGSQGVIIPHSNAGDLMLRKDVVEACAAGRFAVYPVATIQQALELFTGRRAGTMSDGGDYPDGTLLALAVERAHSFWRHAIRGPALLPAPDVEAAAE